MKLLICVATGTDEDGDPVFAAAGWTPMREPNREFSLNQMKEQAEDMLHDCEGPGAVHWVEVEVPETPIVAKRKSIG